jgi:ribosomal protein L11 methylase PrmA
LQSQLKLVSLPGVFGHGKLDEGTKLLLEHLPKLSGSGLDFGCGCGVIALSLATQSTLKVSGLDVSAYAIESCRLNQQYNQINAQIYCYGGCLVDLSAFLPVIFECYGQTRLHRQKPRCCVPVLSTKVGLEEAGKFALD